MALKSTDTCLAKVKADEPIFTLRAQDVTAPACVEDWASSVIMEYHHARKVMPDSARQKVQGAIETAHQMRAWQKANGSKLPD